MADQPKEPAVLVTEYLEKKWPEMHEAFAVESSFNKSNSKYEAKEHHRYVQCCSLSVREKAQIAQGIPGDSSAIQGTNGGDPRFQSYRLFLDERVSGAKKGSGRSSRE
jgi:hypothetical protein